MGLLDDAIREHLELKRLRGADPGHVAREERDALGPVQDGEDTESDEHLAAPEAGAGTSGGDSPQALGAKQDPSFPHVGQETAELDMRTVLGEESAQQASGTQTPSPGSDQAAGTAGDSLEWEMPREQPAGDSQPSAGPDLAPPVDGSQEPVEDVLEETPDFLRETPEQERLWFEQRPPRDFDFDK
jgi:hypothetical protein